MKLYYAKSVCSLAVRVIIHELGILCEYESVNLKTKMTETGKNYLAINPKGSVPLLQLDNDEVLSENAVILQYLADQHHAILLLPPLGTIERYRVLEWLNFVSTDLHRYCAPLFWTRFSEEIKKNVFLPILTKKLDFVDNHLKNHSFLMGNQFTLGDSYLLVILVWVAILKMDMQQWPNLKKYFNRLTTKPSVIKALQEEELSNLVSK